MKVEATPLADVVLLAPEVHADARGTLIEAWRDARYAALGIGGFAQRNLSTSRRGVVRGLHYQRTRPQGKLVTVAHGAIYDVVVDLRRDSPTFRRWWAIELTAVSARQLWIPPGCAHGFQALTVDAVVAYDLTAVYDPTDEAAVRWDDPMLDIGWPIAPAIVSARDNAAPSLAAAPLPAVTATRTAPSTGR